MPLTDEQRAKMARADALRAAASSPVEMQQALGLMLEVASDADDGGAACCHAGSFACELGRYELAERLLREAMVAGWGEAEVWLGVCSLEGPKGSEAAAVAVFERWCERNEGARAWLGWCLANGWGVARDVERARQLLEGPAQQGLAVALHGLGDLEALLAHERGEDWVAASLPHYERAAAVGMAEAKVHVAQVYLQRCARDPQSVESVQLELAHSYLRRAAAFGLVRAKAVLGQALRFGHGIEADPERGVVLIARAAEAGYDWAMYLLGMAFAEGRHVAADASFARIWLRRAHAAGVASAGQALRRLYPVREAWRRWLGAGARS